MTPQLTTWSTLSTHSRRWHRLAVWPASLRPMESLPSTLNIDPVQAATHMDADQHNTRSTVTATLPSTKRLVELGLASNSRAIFLSHSSNTHGPSYTTASQTTVKFTSPTAATSTTDSSPSMTFSSTTPASKNLWQASGAGTCRRYAPPRLRCGPHPTYNHIHSAGCTMKDPRPCFRRITPFAPLRPHFPSTSYTSLHLSHIGN